MAKITFEDKIALDEQAAIADVNKISASDINQIKTVVNGLDDTVSNLGTTLSSSYLPLSGGTLKGDLSFNHTNSTTDGHISWIQGTYQQRLKIIDNSASGSKTFTFQSSSDSGTNWTTLATIANNGTVTATTFVGALSGNATTATTASKADRLTTGRTLTIGNTGKEFAGNANVSWSLSEIGAASSGHTHGTLHSDFTAYVDNTTTDSGWSMVQSGYNNTGFILKSVRYQQYAPNWSVGDYGAGICFGGGDTKGIISHAYNRPYIKFAGGNGSKPVWYISITGSSGANYDLNGIASKATSFVQSSQPTANRTGDIWFSQEVNYGTYNF